MRSLINSGWDEANSGCERGRDGRLGARMWAVTTSGVEGTAQRAANSGALEAMARVGYFVSGVLHVLIGILAVQLATGSGGGSADQSGALSQVSSQPFGQALLWAGAVALLALALWQLSEAVWGGAGADRAKHRGKAAAKGVVYVALALTTFAFARGGSSSSSQQSTDLTASLMGSGPGRLLVAVIGLVIIAVGGYHVVKGAKKKFLQDLRTTGGGHVGRAVTRLGQLGYVAKGVALAVVGGLFVLAAAKTDPSQATGLDGALKTLGEQPGGQVILAVVGLGFVAYGVYSFARARYAKM